MTISDNNRKFLEDLLEYYINESSSYMQIAEEYSDITDSKTDTAFGIIVGIVYSCLLYTSPSPRDVEESRMPSSA